MGAGLSLLVLASCGKHDHDGHDHSNETQSSESSGLSSKSGGHSHDSAHGGLVQTIGSYHVELVHDGADGSLTLFVLGGDEKVDHAVEASLLTAQVRLNGESNFVGVELNPISAKSDPKDKHSRFYGSNPKLIGSKPFSAVIKIPIAGKIYRAKFEMSKDKKATLYVCPMGCEGDKTYSRPGKCPVCDMPMKKQAKAHTDHDSKHGGDLFMAQDGYHHLEGTMTSETEFRVYLYNNFTKPISPKALLGRTRVEFTELNKDGREIGEALSASFQYRKEGNFLSAQLPGSLRLPVYVSLWVMFEDQEKENLFNFSFRKLASKGEHAH